MATKSAIKDVARVQKLPSRTPATASAKPCPTRLPKAQGGSMSLWQTPLTFSRAESRRSSPTTPFCATLYAMRRCSKATSETRAFMPPTSSAATRLPTGCPSQRLTTRRQAKKWPAPSMKGRVIEDTGLIKMDFLGLKTLSIIKDAVENIRQTRASRSTSTTSASTTPPPISSIATEAPSARSSLSLLACRNTSRTAAIHLRGPHRHERPLPPGPDVLHPPLHRAQARRSPIVYDIPVMEKYLKDAYGVTVYQEQVMLLSRVSPTSRAAKPTRCEKRWERSSSRS